MTRYLPKSALAVAGLCALLLSPLAASHFDDKATSQSYRQSYFALLVNNFGPMGAMAKGKIPWDQTALEAYSKDLSAITSLNLMRGFPAGSEQGKTRAKPAIWENLEDFEAKLADLRSAVAELSVVVSSGDKKAIRQQIGATGETCGACHDDYKSKQYLN